jgi:hypothetical protein
MGTVILVQALLGAKSLYFLESAYTLLGLECVGLNCLNVVQHIAG